MSYQRLWKLIKTELKGMCLNNKIAFPLTVPAWGGYRLYAHGSSFFELFPGDHCCECCGPVLPLEMKGRHVFESSEAKARLRGIFSKVLYLKFW